MDVPELIEAWEAAWSARDPGAFAQLCAPDVSYEDPLTREPCLGPAEIGAHAQLLWAAFPDVRVASTGARLRGDGDEARFVAAPCKVLGTHRGPLGPLPPTGRFVIVHAVAYCELDAAGRLSRVRAFYDAYGAAVELGLLPTRGSMAERALLAVRGFGVRRADRR